jgi:hypothetical protein
MFSNPKTTIMALVGFLAVMLNQFGVITLTPEQQSIIGAFVFLVFGFFTGDARSKTLLDE